MEKNNITETPKNNENEFTETFELSKFIQEESFESIIDRFENGRTIDKVKQKSVLSVEEFLKKTESADTKIKCSDR
jgi:ribosome assembly protein YihI (activator of Der GTPase)